MYHMLCLPAITKSEAWGGVGVVWLSAGIKPIKLDQPTASQDLKYLIICKYLGKEDRLYPLNDCIH